MASEISCEIPKRMIVYLKVEYEIKYKVTTSIRNVHDIVAKHKMKFRIGDELVLPSVFWVHM